MLGMYTGFLCYSCRNEFILLSEELERTKGYLACPYCTSRNVKKQKVTDNLKECMGHSSYKKIKGKIRQVTR
ncbi:hypothetical protein AGE29_06740 [Clostridium botulinum]|uniref:Conserved domain protein n=1 Tax=Clostridium botulinum (strain 657 / Type Ba4) TaxID=515621 RepID=A0A3F2ZYD5_CLOB6|nr:hypothetical protein [Clostridium botulinum]ACQ54967.1 conserved domain protein [Clostridium botulinum Ba4 str. 657]APU60226.1 hypothetical protein NPD8_2185 [Clostridium botulinum]AXG91479.1 hypothetical protein AGE29_06740 [Clostridium botulinum]